MVIPDNGYFDAKFDGLKSLIEEKDRNLHHRINEVKKSVDGQGVKLGELPCKVHVERWIMLSRLSKWHWGVTSLILAGIIWGYLEHLIVVK